MAATDIVTGEIVPYEATRTLFRTDDPVEVLDAARSIASVLGPALKEHGMTKHIGQSDHVLIEGWQTIGAMVGVTPHTVWSRLLPDGSGWEAKAEARTLDGRVVGTAEAMCTDAERNWHNSADFEIRSMAQTRAMSKALAAPLRFIVTLSGLSGTPAEEVAGPDSTYGPAANSKEISGLERALGALYDAELGDLPELQALTDRLEKDAGGYLPKIVARALMLAAAHRPAPQADGPGEDDQPKNTPGSDERNTDREDATEE